MMRNYKFRLYPTSEQEARLVGTLGACRWVYNYFIRLAGHGFLTKEDMNYALTELKEQEPWLNQYHSKMLQMVSTQLEGAEQALKVLRRNGYRIGKLHFVRRDDYNTFTYNQSGFKLEKHGNTDLLYLSKIGYIEIRLHRQISGEIKQVTITRKNDGKWYAVVTADMKHAVIIPQIIDFSKSIGIDVGIKNLVYDSDGKATEHPHNLKKMLKPLVRANRKLSRRQFNSQNYKKAKRHYQIIHERIARRRRDYLHKLSHYYATRYDVIFLEKLQIANMVRNHHLAQSITDAGWYTFKQMCDYKSKMMVEVPAKDTTIQCSRCGNKVPKSLAVRIHRCDECGLVIDRDYNSAIEIKNRGLRLLGLPMGCGEVTPVEILAGSMKQEEAHALRHG